MTTFCRRHWGGASHYQTSLSEGRGLGNHITSPPTSRYDIRRTRECRHEVESSPPPNNTALIMPPVTEYSTWWLNLDCAQTIIVTPIRGTTCGYRISRQNMDLTGLTHHQIEDPDVERHRGLTCRNGVSYAHVIPGRQ